ncbi:hypothetical protein Gorai_002665 [Gossypium raimondii]|uniref:Uncharacterized protein n=1 Tax=Gossypium raimondii TaxID=29730 RepID=A0A7J8QLU5_GOSRA|nr:hypothetical protein [Gossypium raimondii]
MVEKERTKSASNEVVGGEDGVVYGSWMVGLGSRFAVMCKLQISEGLEVDMTNVAPREMSLGKKPIVNVRLSIISSGLVEACNVDSKSIKKVCTASSSCTKLFLIRDEIESRDPMIIPLSDNQ